MCITDRLTGLALFIVSKVISTEDIESGTVLTKIANSALAHATAFEDKSMLDRAKIVVTCGALFAITTLVATVVSTYFFGFRAAMILGLPYSVSLGVFVGVRAFLKLTEDSESFYKKVFSYVHNYAPNALTEWTEAKLGKDLGRDDHQVILPLVEKTREFLRNHNFLIETDPDRGVGISSRGEGGYKSLADRDGDGNDSIPLDQRKDESSEFERRPLQRTDASQGLSFQSRT